MKIIFISSGGIGDVVVASPTIVAIAKKYPSAQKDLLVFKGAHKEVFRGSPYINKIIEFDYFKRQPTSKKKFRIPYLKELWTLFKLRLKHYDLSVTPFPYHSKLNEMATRIINAKERIGFDADVYTKKAKIIKRTYEKDDIHDVEQNLNLLKFLGIPKPKNPKLFFQINDEDRKFAKDWIKRLEPDKKIFCFNPMAYWKRKTKTWDPDKYAKLADILIDDYNGQVVFLGTPDGEDQVNYIMSKMKHPAVKELNITLKQTAAIIELTDLFVGNDSALMHISASTGTPTIGFTRTWGYNSLRPYTEKHLYLRKRMPEKLMKELKEKQEEFCVNWTEEMDEKYFKAIPLEYALKEIRKNEKKFGLK